MGLYCPKCYSNGISVKSTGVVRIAVNKIPIEAGAVLFNFGQEISVFKENIAKKISDFLKWYSDLENRSPINRVEIFSSDFSCNNLCNLNGTRISVINELISAQELAIMVKEVALPYGVEVELSLP